MGKSSYPYREIPILDAARRCGLVLNERTVGREEVEASCPFCGDNGPGKYHLSLNTSKNVYRCNLCSASGNSVSLYARLEGVDFRQAFEDLSEAGRLYRFPEQPLSQKPPEREPAPLSRRHDVYYDMLSHLELSPRHREDLLKRGLSEERIARNMYRSLPQSSDGRRFLAGMLADFHDLAGIPGFFVKKGFWTVAGKSGLLVPFCDMDGYIQGLQVRLDDATNRKYRWLASRGMEYGTRSLSWIHVTGDRNARTAYLTEGGLKGDVASFLDGDALFLCFAGVSAIGGLKETLRSLPNVSEAVIALDMDKLMNWHVRDAVEKIAELVKSLGLRCRLMNWNMTFKGVDDFYQARNYAESRGVDIQAAPSNYITSYLDDLWAQKYPSQDPGFIHTCEWEELTIPLTSLKCGSDEETDAPAIQLRTPAPDAAPLVCVNGTVIDGRERFRAYQKSGVKNVTIYQNKPWAMPAAA